MAQRFPIPRYPTGWFQVLWSDELEPGQVMPKHVFGQELVLFRTEAGEVGVLDAYCPHLGAHLGHGGCVEGDSIRCPFHAWKFDKDGTCTEVPYAKKIPPKAKAKAWHVRDQSGMILVWHDIDGRDPLWEVPVFEEIGHEEWSEPIRRQWKFRSHNQEMGENVVDTAHFKYLHGMQQQPPAVVELRDHVFHMETPTFMTSGAGDVQGTLTSDSYGFGVATNRFTGFVETFVLGNVVAIDDEFVEVRFTFVVRKAGGADITRGIGKAFAGEVARQLEQDIPVWENKDYFHRPVLCDGDGPFMKYRSWAKQFFPDWYRERAKAVWEAEQQARPEYRPEGV